MKNINQYGWPAAIIAIVALVFSIRSCHQNKVEQQGYINMVQAYKDSTRHWQNKAGEEVAIRKVIEGQADVVKSFMTKEDIAALEARFDLKFKNLKSAITIVSDKVGILGPTGDPQVVYVSSGDTAYSGCPVYKPVSYMKQTFGNPYDSVWVRVGDSAYARIKSRDTTYVATHRDYTRKFLSKNWFTSVAVTNRNPSVTNKVDGAFVISDSYRDKYVDLSVRGGYRYFNKDAVQSAPYLGGEVNYYLKRASLSGSFNKLLNNTKWYFVEISGKYTLFRL